MYVEVLTESWVQEQAGLVVAAIDRFLSSGEESVQLGDETITASEFRAARDALGSTLSAGAPMPRDPDSAPSAYLPRDALISCLQSGFQRAGDHRAAVAQGPDRLRLDVAEAATSDLVSALETSDHLPAVSDDRMPPMPQVALEERIDVEPGSFDPFPTDPVWAGAIALALGWRFIHGQHAFNPAPALAQLGDPARICLLSDWGTGIPRAVAVSGQVRERISDVRGQVHVIHLGDVYYAGWPWEQQRHVLDVWPVPRAEPHPAFSWALPGNHDMYSGGNGYFKTLLGDPRFAAQHSNDGKLTSFFELNNEHWRVIGLDTASRDHDLIEPQVEWLESRILDAKSAGQSVILLSHHQLFTAFGHLEGGQLQDRLGAFLRQEPVRAWFWGHEHRCTLYRATPEVKKARCIGNGGVPAYVTRPDSDHDPGGVELDYEVVFGPADDGRDWRNFAFVVVDLDGSAASVAYVDEHGTTFHNETL
jgi:Calcineurin-like phosphoesterase